MLFIYLFIYSNIPTTTKEKTKIPAEKIEKSFLEFSSPLIGRQEFARKQKEMNAGKYTDDPRMRERADDVVDEWLRQGL